jgi:site-specific DNA-methyltransferase (adenine-specific)
MKCGFTPVILLEDPMKGEIRLLRGRLKFEGGKHSAPFPSAIIVFRPRGYELRGA